MSNSIDWSYDNEMGDEHGYWKGSAITENEWAYAWNKYTDDLPTSNKKDKPETETETEKKGFFQWLRIF